METALEQTTARDFFFYFPLRKASGGELLQQFCRRFPRGREHVYREILEISVLVRNAVTHPDHTRILEGVFDRLRRGKNKPGELYTNEGLAEYVGYLVETTNPSIENIRKAREALAWPADS